MKASYSAMGRALLVGIMFATAAYSEPRAEEARQQIRQAVASGNVQSVISALPTLEEMWPEAMEEYFQTAEEIVRFLNGAMEDPAVQQALEALYDEALDKRCPRDVDLARASAYFKEKQKFGECFLGFDHMRYNKPILLAVSRFLGEIRDWRIPHYEYKRSWAEVAVLDKAGVSFAVDLTDPKDIEAYEEAMRQNDRDLDISRFQYILFRADSNLTFVLLGSCKQLRHDGKLDEAFANEVAENARLTEKEREMRYEFDKDK